MSFIQIAFGYFLPIVYGLWMLVRDRYLLAVPLLLTASLLFYGYNQWWVLPIILSYCFVDWLTGVWLERTNHRRLVLAAGVTFNLAVLCFWKYTPLLVETAAALAGWGRVGVESVASGTWVVPMGISFYAFTGIAYMVDVYRRELAAETNFWRYSLFTSFFPHLVAGPILRPREFLVHLRPEAMPKRPIAASEGAFLIARGFFKKMVLADSLALAIDPFFAHVGDASTAGVWALPYIYLYAFQIYFDFSGYTDIARGLGLWFGFRWPENFNWPYLATSVQDFWRRWHMTLSRFLRDYLYIPLGGSTNGPWRTALNQMLTMLLGGLWHGASWSFMLWGGLHGTFLIVNRLWGTSKLHGRLEALAGARMALAAYRIDLPGHLPCMVFFSSNRCQRQPDLPAEMVRVRSRQGICGRIGQSGALADARRLWPRNSGSPPRLRRGGAPGRGRADVPSAGHARRHVGWLRRYAGAGAPVGAWWQYAAFHLFPVLNRMR
jgi:alginate O-acetyltransferase complex protein AlgI